MTPEVIPEGEALPAECGHKGWTLGCERCFWEMNGIAQGKIREAVLDDQIKGAVLFNWHVVMVIADMEAQLVPLSESMDIHRSQLGIDLIANLRNLSYYLMKLVADPGKLVHVMEQAALIATQTHARMAAERAPAGAVTLTDR